MATCLHDSGFALAALCALAIAFSACGSDDRGDGAAAGDGGQAASAGETAGGSGGQGASGAGGVGGSSGGSGIGGAAGASGAGAGAAGAGSGGMDAATEPPRDGGLYDGNLGPVGTIPLGAICANDLNCSQDQGPAVCCVSVCRLSEDCPGGSYLHCVTGSDCDAFGGGKVCCDVPGMRFCTKPSACEGEVIR